MKQITQTLSLLLVALLVAGPAFAQQDTTATRVKIRGLQFVDANGDGSDRNDVAFVPDADQLGALANDWKCLSDQAGGFASRNSCRGPAVHSVNARLHVTFARVGGRRASLVLDGFNLVESSEGLVDNALHLIDPTGSITTSPDGATVTLPTEVNQGFGTVIYPSTRGRMLRIGVRIGG